MCRAGPAYTPSLGRLDVVYEVLEAEPDALPLAGGSLNGLMTTHKARRPRAGFCCARLGEREMMYLPKVQSAGLSFMQRLYASGLVPHTHTVPLAIHRVAGGDK